MNDTNSLIIEGEIKDVAMSEKDGVKLCSFTLTNITDYKTSSGERAKDIVTVECECLGNFAGLVEKYAAPKRKARVVGRIAMKRLADSGTEQPCILVEHIRF